MRNLSIVGLHGSGKTCYLYAMAETLRRGLCGLSFRTNCDGWQKIIKELRWPPGTDIGQEYTFQCLHSGSLFSDLDFLCYDYKGGILSSFDSISRMAKMDLMKYIQYSDGIIILIAADMLGRILMNDPDAEDDLTDLYMLKEIIAQTGEKMKQIPITIAITKSDLLNNKENTLLFSLVKELFPFIFNATLHLNTLIVPVSLGRNLSNNNCNSEGIVYTNPSDGNIHIPILFNLYHILDNQIKTSISFKDIAVLTSIKSIIKKELVAYANNNIIELNTI